MKLTTKLLKELIKEELSRITETGPSDFKQTASYIGNELHGVGFGLSGEGMLELKNYIIGVLENPESKPKMPGKFSDKVYNHGDVADTVRNMMPDYRIGDDRSPRVQQKIDALVREILGNIKDRG